MMQTINVDGTTYTLKFDRDPIAWAKAARKPYKPAKPKDIRKFPAWSPNVSTAAYIRTFNALNALQQVEYHGASETGTAQYDPTIPLLEVLNDE
jgi:hypothetical protein